MRLMTLRHLPSVLLTLFLPFLSYNLGVSSLYSSLPKKGLLSVQLSVLQAISHLIPHSAHHLLLTLVLVPFLALSRL